MVAHQFFFGSYFNALESRLDMFVNIPLAFLRV